MLIRGAYALRIFLLPTVTNETGKVNRMARPDKTTAVAELAEDFRTANATVLTEYRGLSVTSMKELRRALGSTTKYSVVKNTLTKIAAKDAGVEIADDLLTGPSAVAFIKGDPIDAAKSLRDFAKENPFLVIKGGKIEFRVDKNSNLHFLIGKVSFTADQLAENYAAAMEEVMRAKPNSSKGRYVQKAVVSTTMGPGIAVDPNLVREPVAN